jgi:MOB kinase activator 1
MDFLVDSYTDLIQESDKLHKLVSCPKDRDQKEWISWNLKNFFVQINLLYGTVVEFCTDSGCPIMAAGPSYEYRWWDDVSKVNLKN